jgi:hypothetical protein
MHVYPCAMRVFGCDMRPLFYTRKHRLALDLVNFCISPRAVHILSVDMPSSVICIFPHHRHWPTHSAGEDLGAQRERTCQVHWRG